MLYAYYISIKLEIKIKNQPFFPQMMSNLCDKHNDGEAWGLVGVEAERWVSEH